MVSDSQKRRGPIGRRESVAWSSGARLLLNAWRCVTHTIPVQVRLFQIRDRGAGSLYRYTMCKPFNKPSYHCWDAGFAPSPPVRTGGSKERGRLPARQADRRESPPARFRSNGGLIPHRRQAWVGCSVGQRRKACGPLPTWRPAPGWAVQQQQNECLNNGIHSCGFGRRIRRAFGDSRRQKTPERQLPG